MATALEHCRGTLADVATLAAMNLRLNEDEHRRNPMTLAELATQMREMISADYVATIFIRDGRSVAYALWRDEPESIYLRQFYVDREHRRQGIGREALALLEAEIWPAGRRIRVNCLIRNQSGLAFWHANGYADYLMTLERERT